MSYLRLSSKSDGNYVNDYDPKLSPEIANEFAAAAYRFGHSQIKVRYPITFLSISLYLFIFMLSILDM